MNIPAGYSYDVGIEGNFIIGAVLNGKLYPFLIPTRGKVKVSVDDMEHTTVIQQYDPLMQLYYHDFGPENRWIHKAMRPLYP